MRKYFFSIVLLLSCTAICLQAQVDDRNARVWVLNEGVFGGRGTLGYIDLPCLEYQHFDSIPTFSTDLKTENGLVFLAASDGMFHIYGRETPAIASFEWQVRKFKMYSDSSGYYFIASCTEPPFVRYFHVPTNLLSFQTIWQSTIEQAPNETDGVLWDGNPNDPEGSLAYISMNGLNGFGINAVADTRLIVLNITNQVSFLKYLDTPVNPNAILKKDQLIVVQCLNYNPGSGGLSIHTFDLGNENFETTIETGLGSYGGFSILNDDLFFNRADLVNFVSTGISSFNFVSEQLTDFASGSFTGLTSNQDMQYLFVMNTDYTSTGSIIINKLLGNSSEIETYVAPSILAYDDWGNVNSVVTYDEVCENHVFPYDLELAGPFSNASWNDQFQGLNRSFSDTGLYELTIQLSETCSLNKSFQVNQVISQPDFVFDLPDTLNVEESEAIFDLRGPLSEQEDAMWMIESPLTLVSENASSDTIQVEIKGGVSGWIYFSVQFSECEFIVRDSMYVQYPNSRNPLLNSARILVPYPNPTTSSSFLLAEESIKNLKSLTLFDLAGRELIRWEHSSTISNTFELKGIVSGTYLLKAKDKDGSMYSSRLIVL